jgi:Ser/Thr protein kinase RdoA (MazF antagonist)
MSLRIDAIGEIIGKKYLIGEFVEASEFENGNVQSTYMLKTTKGKYVLKYFDLCNYNWVHFEIDLITYILNICPTFPTAHLISNIDNEYITIVENKPLVLYEYIEHEYIEHDQKSEQTSELYFNKLVAVVAKLHIITEGFNSEYPRENIFPQTVLSYAFEEKKAINEETLLLNYALQEKNEEVLLVNNGNERNFEIIGSNVLGKRFIPDISEEQLNSEVVNEKYKWYEKMIPTLILPNDLPIGVCHLDLNPTNILLDNNGEITAIIDFDGSTITYLILDLIDIIEMICWGDDSENLKLDLIRAKRIIKEYMKVRPLSEVEKEHFFDAHKLLILVEGNHGDFYKRYEYFDRETKELQFFEKRKIEYLEYNITREHYYNSLFI